MRNRTTLGIISLCLGIFVFSAQDAIIKHLSGSYSVTQAVVIRSLVALPILALLIHRESGLASILSGRAFWLVLRATAMFVSYTGYYLAFPVLPLAEAVALFFAAPLFITVMAIPV